MGSQERLYQKDKQDKVKLMNDGSTMLEIAKKFNSEQSKEKVQTSTK